MAVTEQDVRHVAALARLAIDAARVPVLVAELNGILAHMDVLADVDTGDVDPVLGVGAGGTRLRADEGPAYPLARDRASFAPAMREGFFVVPRLDAHVEGARPTADGAFRVDEGRAS